MNPIELSTFQVAAEERLREELAAVGENIGERFVCAGDSPEVQLQIAEGPLTVTLRTDGASLRGVPRSTGELLEFEGYEADSESEVLEKLIAQVLEVLQRMRRS